jgi:hypothetical protein
MTKIQEDKAIPAWAQQVLEWELPGIVSYSDVVPEKINNDNLIDYCGLPLHFGL